MYNPFKRDEKQEWMSLKWTMDSDEVL